MGGSYYDVIVLGSDLGPLCAGALLANRGYRVLVIPDGSPANYYSCYGFKFAKKPFALLGADSPVFSKVVSELCLGQLWSHLLVEPAMGCQLVLPDMRLDIYSDPAKTEKEILREISVPEARISNFLCDLGCLCGDFEKLMSNDLVIPPESFFERREYARAMFQNPFHNQPAVTLEKYLRISPDLAQRLFLPSMFEGGGKKVPALVAARQLGTWFFDVKLVKGGLDALAGLFLDRIEDYGGSVHEGYKVEKIEVRRGKVYGIRLAGKEELIPSKIVLSSSPPSVLCNLVEPLSWTDKFSALVEDDGACMLGYVVNIGVSSEVVPPGMAHTVFLKTNDEVATLLRIEQIPQDDPQKAVFNVSCLVEKKHEELILSGALRDAILDGMRQLVPYLDNYLCAIHSPYDGFGPLSFSQEKNNEKLDAPMALHSEEIPSLLVRLPQDGIWGGEGLPHRTGIKGLFLCGDHVVCGLGAEGEFLAALGCSKVAGKFESGRQKVSRPFR